MTTLLITPKNNAELKFISEFLRKIGVAAKPLNEDEKEEMGLAILMKQANRNHKVSRATIMKKLRTE